MNFLPWEYRVFKEHKNHVITAGHHLVVNAKYSIHNVEDLNSNKRDFIANGPKAQIHCCYSPKLGNFSLLFKSGLKCTLLKRLQRLFVDVE